MIQIRQQSRHDLMLRLSASDCQQLLRTLRRLESREAATPLDIDIDARVLKFSKPRIVKLYLTRADNDGLHRVGVDLAWTIDTESLNGMIDKMAAALQRGYFSVAELMTVRGISSWLRLYVELHHDNAS